MKSAKIRMGVVCLYAASLGACASQPDSIQATYVSPTIYERWDCDQLFEEKARLSSKVRQVAGLQQENADADTAMMAGGIILFWPALFGLALTKDREQELGRLKGEYQAVDQQITSRNCAMPANLSSQPEAKEASGESGSPDYSVPADEGEI